MYSKTILFCVLLFYAGICGAQTVISSSGDSFENSSVKVSYTLGEPVIETLTAGGNTLTQGFQQPPITIVGATDASFNLKVMVFPNPAFEELYVEIAQYEQVQYQIFDLNGKLLEKGDLTSVSTQIDVSPLSSGTYLLTLINESNQGIITYKIIKQ